MHIHLVYAYTNYIYTHTVYVYMSVYRYIDKFFKVFMVILNNIFLLYISELKKKLISIFLKKNGERNSRYSSCMCEYSMKENE